MSEYAIFEAVNGTNNWRLREIVTADTPDKAVKQMLKGSKDEGTFMVVATRFINVLKTQTTVTQTVVELELPAQ